MPEKTYKEQSCLLSVRKQCAHGPKSGTIQPTFLVCIRTYFLPRNIPFGESQSSTFFALFSGIILPNFCVVLNTFSGLILHQICTFSSQSGRVLSILN